MEPTPIPTAAPAAAATQEDPGLGYHLLLEHSRSILTILASADATSQQIFNQVD